MPVVVGTVFVAVLLLTLSTARAHQLWNEQQAQRADTEARAAAHHQLASAHRLGVTDAELAPYRQQTHVLDLQRAPEGSPFWNAARYSFYRSQRAAFHKLAGRIREEIGRSAATARNRGSVHAADLRSTITTARTFELNVLPAQSALDAWTRVLRNRTATPGQLRDADLLLAAAAAALRTTVRSREAEVQRVVAGVHGSLPALLARADTMAATAHSQLGLLALAVPKDLALGSPVDKSLAVVHEQKDAFSAALKLPPLQSAVAAVDARYATDMPSKMIVVSTEDQSVRMYENGRTVYSSYVTTGGPELPTDHGVFHIYAKISPFTFHSPWPVGSPYYYPPSPVSYWMPFDGAQGLHDAPWRTNWGPGSNFTPTDLGGHYILGTHGCVNLPPDAAQFMWNWAPIGTAVVVV